MSRPISAGYLERKLRAIAGVQGSNPLPDLSDLSGLLVIENDRPEWGYPANEMRYMAPLTTGTPAAGLVSWVAFQNPAGSGVLAVIEGYVTFGAINADWWLNVTTQALAQRGFNRDLRISKGDPVLAVSSACGLHSSITEAAGGSGQGPCFPAHVAPEATNSSEMRRVEFIVPPGQNIAVKASTLIQPQTTAFWWRERPIEGAYELR